jgi:acetyl esterase
MANPSITENGSGYFLTQADMAWFYRQYLPGGLEHAAEADLAHADVAGVAPAVIATAEFDPLRDDGAAYAARLKDAGVPVEYVPGPGLIHGFAAFGGIVDAAEANVATALRLFSEFLLA